MVGGHPLRLLGQVADEPRYRIVTHLGARVGRLNPSWQASAEATSWWNLLRLNPIIGEVSTSCNQL